MLTTLSTRRATRSQDLVDLLGECHDRIRRFVALAHKAASQRDAPAKQVAEACADVERYFSEALPLHMADEEESVEPRLRGLSPEIDRVLDMMALQHEHHASNLRLLLRSSAEVRKAPHHETARDELAVAATHLGIEFEEHLALEESVIFPAIREFLSCETQALIINELRQRRRNDDPRAASGLSTETRDETL